MELEHTEKATVLELLTIDEMAAFLKVPKSWLYRQTMNTAPGAIPVLRVGKYLRFDPTLVVPWAARTFTRTGRE